MTDLLLTADEPAAVAADALVLAIARRSDDTLLLGAEALPGPVVDRLADAISALGLRGGADEVTRLPAGDGLGARMVVLSGVGELAEGARPGPEDLRRAAGGATRGLDRAGVVAVLFPTETADEVGAVAEGALLGAYRFRRYRTADPAGPEQVRILTRLASAADATAAAERARVVARAVAGVRDLVNSSPRDVYPESFAQEAERLSTGTGVAVRTWDDAALRDGGYGGLIGVGQGSNRPPRLVRLEYQPPEARGHVALVGKGITFDSGGLSIKPAKAMETMKCDMAGAAAVLHTVLAAAALAVPVRVTGWLALAENMPSGTAQRPSDVITIRGGTTVEVLNTDAEGRLVLADALSAACDEGPDVVVDIATLTGAQIVALGNQVAAVMGADEVRSRVVEAANRSGESVWPMPLPEELAATLKSTVADLANMGERSGGMLVAGIFLRHFVGSTPWAHLDVAGPAFNEGNPRGYTPKGGTGFGVRTLLGFLEGQGRR